jgi:Reverse transcriptase (RNA-dependent DNA polymerase)
VKKFGSRAEEVAMKDMEQMIERDCFEPIHQEELNETERRRAMESLIFLSEKKDKSIKARHCANGSTQQSYMQREEVSSPTVSTESTMLTAVIEAKEGRDVATCDIPNAFIQTEVEEVDKQGNHIIMKIRGVLVELSVWIVPEFEEFVIEEGSSKVLYLRVKKAIYGMLESVLLFYMKLSGNLIQFGFQVNPYDPCVANKLINQAQMTV